MKKNIFLIFLLTISFVTLAQSGKYDFSVDTGEYVSNSENVFYIIGGIIVLSLFGGWKLFKTVVLFFAGIFALFGIAGGYMYLLMKIGIYLQVATFGDTPKNNSVGLISVLTFIVGWFTPIWIYSKRSSKKNE